MKEYKEYGNVPTAAGEPSASYSAVSSSGKIVPSVLMDELMNQSDEVKLYIISQLSESMMRKAEAKLGENQAIVKEQNSYTNVAEWEKQVEVKREYYRQKYNLPESLINLIGCVPPHTDEEREKVREEYLMEKYGRR